MTTLTGPAQASIRPEDIELRRSPPRPSLRNCFRGRVTDIADRGTRIYVTVDIPPEFVCAITRHSLGKMALREGVSVHIAFKASAVHVF